MMELEKVLKFLNIKKEDMVNQWEAREIDVEYGSKRRKGLLFLTKDELIFVAEVGVFSKKLKELYRIPILSIKSAGKLPLSKTVRIGYTKASKEAGFLKKVFGMRNVGFKIQDPKSLIQKLKELNPKIK